MRACREVVHVQCASRVAHLLFRRPGKTAAEADAETEAAAEAEAEAEAVETAGCEREGRRKVAEAAVGERQGLSPADVPSSDRRLPLSLLLSLSRLSRPLLLPRRDTAA